MKRHLKKILAYILRGWDNEPEPPIRTIKILPPFFYELLAYLLLLAILYSLFC